MHGRRGSVRSHAPAAPRTRLQATATLLPCSQPQPWPAPPRPHARTPAFVYLAARPRASNGSRSASTQQPAPPHYQPRACQRAGPAGAVAGADQTPALPARLRAARPFWGRFLEGGRGAPVPAARAPPQRCGAPRNELAGATPRLQAPLRPQRTRPPLLGPARTPRLPSCCNVYIGARASLAGMQRPQAYWQPRKQTQTREGCSSRAAGSQGSPAHDAGRQTTSNARSGGRTQITRRFIQALGAVRPAGAVLGPNGRAPPSPPLKTPWQPPGPPGKLPVGEVSSRGSCSAATGCSHRTPSSICHRRR